MTMPFSMESQSYEEQVSKIREICDFEETVSFWFPSQEMRGLEEKDNIQLSDFE